jgi:hypothetical protein
MVEWGRPASTPCIKPRLATGSARCRAAAASGRYFEPCSRVKIEKVFTRSAWCKGQAIADFAASEAKTEDTVLHSHEKSHYYSNRPVRMSLCYLHTLLISSGWQFSVSKCLIFLQARRLQHASRAGLKSLRSCKTQRKDQRDIMLPVMQEAASPHHLI